ncbi:MAG: hypothetical protein LBI57_06180 [Helicobacteraceae bacterium]|jgi:lipopolysaccharide biosynthesis glycosyltransferase|nr:hypothetical protein [Helicobacteraceae bacterium]
MNLTNNPTDVITEQQSPSFAQTLALQDWYDHPIVVLASDEYYAKFTAATMLSIARNTDAFVEFHILESKIADETKAKIRQTLSAHSNCSITYHDVSFLNLLQFKGKYCHSEFVFLRYYAPVVLKDKKRVLYIDSDIVFAYGDIAELYNQDIADKTIGAVEEDYAEIYYAHFKKLCGKEREEYKLWNSGVILFNVDRFIRNNYIELLEAKTLQLKDQIRFNDQDVMMIVFKDDCALLDYKFNFQSCNMKLLYIKDPSKFAQIAPKPFLIHYASDQKPWNSAQVPYASFFLKTAADTAFSDEIRLLKPATRQMYISKLERSTKIPVVFACDEARAPLLATALFSILENVGRFIEFFILDDGLSTSSKKVIDDVIKEFNSYSLTYIDLTSRARRGFFDIDDLPLLNYAHFLAPRLLGDKNKILCFDVSIIARGDVAQIYETDLCGYPLGAAPDFSEKSRDRAKIKYGIERYFSAGVLLIDVKKFIEGDYEEKLAKSASTLGYSADRGAQDALNIALANNIKALERRFNIQEDAYRANKTFFTENVINDIVFNPVIANFSSERKPWSEVEYENLSLWAVAARIGNRDLAALLECYNANRQRKTVREIKLFGAISLMRVSRRRDETFYAFFGVTLFRKIEPFARGDVDFIYGANRILGSRR